MEIKTEDNDDTRQEGGHKKLVLLLLDGYGISQNSEANAFSLAKSPFIDKAISLYPAIALKSGVGDLNNRYLSIGSGSATVGDDEDVNSDLSKIISDSGLKQLKVFDSERLAPISYFFNGRREEKLLGEDWISVSVANSEDSYNIFEANKKIFQETVKAVKEDNYDFIVATCPIFDYLATNSDTLELVSAIEGVDKQIKKLATEIIDKDAILLISSAHGHAEKMIDLASDTVNREITNNPVPFIIIDKDLEGKSYGFKDTPEGDLSLADEVGGLENIAPTIIDLLNLDKNKKSDLQAKSLLEID